MLAEAALFALLAADLPAALWRDPGRVETIDFSAAAGGATIAPKPPFRYMAEPAGGTSLKVLVSDGNGLVWRAKAGPEARADTFATRLAAALGYFSEIMWFLPETRIEVDDPTQRLPRPLDPVGRLTWAAFELREPDTQFLPEQWTWNDSRFSGTVELKGLKLLMILLSNWDNKDGRDAARGSNIGVWERDDNGRRVRAFFVNDWGQSLGAWKSHFGNGTPWDCGAFTRQTGRFLIDASGPALRFGYRGHHTADFANDITRTDVRWFMQYAGRITDAQIQTGLLVSGASKEEQGCFTSALRDRLEQLRKAAL
jgi:hypothetical protein